MKAFILQKEVESNIYIQNNNNKLKQQQYKQPTHQQIQIFKTKYFQSQLNSNLQLISKMERQGVKKMQFTSPFLEKTYNLLENPELQNIISWNEDGTMIVINNIQELSNILPKYFKHRKIESFIRQLNIYDFKKVKKQIAVNAFKHPCFLRNDFSKLHLIKRRVKSNKSQRTICDSPQLSCKQSGQNTSQTSEKLCQYENNFEILQQIQQPIQQNFTFQSDGFDYLVQDIPVTLNNGYYDWEDVFA